MEKITDYFRESENKGKTLQIEVLSPEESNDIQKMCEKNHLKSILRRIEKKRVVLVTDSKFDIGVIDLKEDEIEFFCKYSGIGLPNYNPKNFSYYLDLMDKYTGCNEECNLFLESLSKFLNLGEMKHHFKKVSDVIVKKIEENEEICKLKQSEPTDEIKKVQFNKEHMSNTYFKKEFCGTELISIDIKSANISVVNLYAPSFLNGMTWEQYVSGFTNCKYLIKSKQFREMICGKAKLTKLGSKRYPYLLRKGLDTINEIQKSEGKEYLKDDKIIGIVGDELIIKKKCV